MKKGDPLDGPVWIDFFNHVGPDRFHEKIGALEAMMDKLVSDVVEASPKLSIKRRRAFRRYQDKKQRGLLFSAALEARRIGVRGENLNILVYLLR